MFAKNLTNAEFDENNYDTKRTLENSISITLWEFVRKKA